MNHYWDRVDKAVAAMGWPSFHGMLEGVWQEALAIKLEETKAKIDKLETLADQVDCLLDKARKVTLSSAYIDEREQWLVSDSFFQEVQKAFYEVKS